MYVALLFFLVLKPSLVDINPVFDQYYTSISIEQENQRLDLYAFLLKNTPSSRALITVYAENGKTVKTVQARARRAARYLVKTGGVDPKRVVWRYEAVCKHNMIVLFHLYPDWADPARDTKCLR